MTRAKKVVLAYSGGVDSSCIPFKQSFVKDYAFDTIQANDLYENPYSLGTALAHPLIAKLLETKKYGANAITDSRTGKGNDQSLRYTLK